MLSEILTFTGLDAAYLADILAVPQNRLKEWLDGAGVDGVPRYLRRDLTAILGADPFVSGETGIEQRLRPTIWYKLRGDALPTKAEAEAVAFIRKLCSNFADLRLLLKAQSPHESVIERIRDSVDHQAPIRSQAAEAAKSLRRVMGWDQGAVGIGDLIRPNLLRAGLVIAESPIDGSLLEGCAFGISARGNETNCVFANSYHSTWFRRNSIIAHEVCHAIFDLSTAGEKVSLDYKYDSPIDPSEERANFFSRDLLIPLEVLRHYENQLGIKWGALSQEGLALLIANCHVEQKTILSAAREHGLISQPEHDRYLKYECSALLKLHSEHARTTEEFLASISPERRAWHSIKRRAKLGNRTFMLPMSYLKLVAELYESHRITLQRAAGLAMIDPCEFAERFGIAEKVA